MRFVIIITLILMSRCFSSIDEGSHVVKGDPWMVIIPTEDHLGNKVDIVVYPKALINGGFVVNLHSEYDKIRHDGRCNGTTIFREVPKQ